jgi:hypothetical protein
MTHIDTTPVTPPEDADSLHSLIYQAYVEGELHLGLKYFQLNRRGSPVYKLWENILPFAMIAAIVAQYTYDYGLTGFALSLLITGLLGFYFIPRWLAKRVRARGMAMAVSGEAGWDELWRAGCLSIRMADNPEHFADSPQDDWRAFVRAHLENNSRLR